jgi:uncharacterized protein YndB with AHSA1/START domain
MSPTHALQVSKPSDLELVMTRTFDAPAHLVFQALTTPALLQRWYGAGGWSLVSCEIDLKVGGAWRFVTRRPDGKEIGQHGVYREITSGRRLVNTESWEDWNPGELLVTTVLDEENGKTRFTSTLLFPSQKVRDMLLDLGMTSGAADSYDRLAECLASLASERMAART